MKRTLPMFISPHPVLPGFHSDPSVCRAGDDYYLTTSSFEYSPGCPLFHSRDLKIWTPIGHILTTPTQLPLREAWISGGIYAPTLRFHDGWFYLITTNMSAPGRPHHSRNFIVRAPSPLGPWSEPAWIDGMEGIDPDLFWDEDGTCYTQWSWRGQGRPVTDIAIHQAHIDPIAGRLLESPRPLWHGTGGLGPEGPHLFRHAGWVYLLIAEGGTEYAHMQTAARSRLATGPFLPCPHNPILTHRSLASPVQGVGHADLVQTPSGQWHGVAHGFRPSGYHPYHVLGRETFSFPVTWTKDAWPILGNHGRLPPSPPPPSTDFIDEFSSSNWPTAWNWLRNPDPANYQRTPDHGLLLTGSADKLTSYGRPTWIGLRQTSHTCTIHATISAELHHPEAETGLAVWQNLEAHFLIGLRLSGDSPVLFTRRRVLSLCLDEEHPLPCPPSAGLVLTVESTPQHYTVGLTLPDGTFQPLTRLEARFLSTEVAGRFTGVFFSLFATGSVTAHCRRFAMRPLDT